MVRIIAIILKADIWLLSGRTLKSMMPQDVDVLGCYEAIFWSLVKFKIKNVSKLMMNGIKIKKINFFF